MCNVNRIRRGICSITLVPVVAATIMAFASMAAQAQEASELEEIIVTAQFREQRLQDTPIAITAITDEMLRVRSVDSVFQVANFAPNVSLAPAPGPFGSSMNAFIRGIGQDDFNFAREPGVGIYIDDVYFPTLTGSVFEVLDLERIEVLRGPQGTLQGRNSIGGAIRLITRKPTGDGGGFAELTFGRFNRIAGHAAGEFALAPDKLVMRISGVFNEKDGYQDRLDFACVDPATAAANGIPSAGIGSGSCKIGTLGGKSYAAGRAHLRWTPSERVDISIVGDLTNDKSEANANTLIAAEGTPPPPSPGPQNATPGYGNHFVPSSLFVSYETFCDPGSVDLGFGVFPTSLTGAWCTPPINHVTTWGVAAIMDFQVSDSFSIKSISSYRELTNDWATSTDGSPLGGETGWNAVEGDSFQQELRANLSVGDALGLTFGVFYFEQDISNAARIDIPYTGTAPAFPFDFITDEDFNSESLGVYAQATFRVTDAVNITAGARYSDEEKFQVTRRLDPATGGTSGSTIPPFAGCADPITGVCGTNTFTTDRVDYRASIDYRWSDGFMTFLSYATGFKSGGVSPRYFFANQFLPYGEEEADAIEFGFKSNLADNRLRLNGSYFVNQYDDQQLGSSICPDLVPPAPCLADRNLVDSEISGFELEATFAPNDRILIDASYSWIDNEFTRVEPVISPLFIVGSDVPEQTPQNKYNIGIQFDFPFASGASITPRVDVIYEDEKNGFNETRANGFDFSRPIPLDSYTLVNFNLIWRSADDDWEAKFALTNATDKEYFWNYFDISGFGGWAGGQPAPPREWALSMRRNFK